MKKSFDISKYLKEHKITAGIVDKNLNWLNEAESDKYAHIGYGKYKEKGKEDDETAPTFKKDGEKFVPFKSDDTKGGKSKTEPAKPKVNIFDKPKKTEPKKPVAKKPEVSGTNRDRSEKTYKPKFKKDSIVYNKNTKTVGIVRMTDDTYGEVRTDADGMVDIDSLEPYNPKIHKNAQIAPSTKKEIEARQQNKTSKSKEVPSTKLKTLMPKSDPKAFSGQSDIGKIDKKQRREISMKIDELDKISKEAKSKGENAPNYNLCKITVPGTNLYCDNNLGVPREDMPQFKGKPQPMSPASKMKVDASGEVDTEPLFKKMLAKKGIKTYQTEIPSDALKATQSELVGAKVAGMTKALDSDPTHPGITAQIYVSRDGYVIDGHHRWAAITSKAISDGKPTNMKVVVIDDDARNIIPMANKFAEEIGVAAKKADANQEGPSTPTKDSTNSRSGNPKINKLARGLAQKLGITPQKLGKEEYQKQMAQAAVSALTDANAHDEARLLISKLENNPKFAEDPTQRKDYVGYGKPGYDDFRKTTAWSSEYMNPEKSVEDFGTTISNKSDWNPDTAIDAIAFDLKMNGFKELASKIQSVFENKTNESSLMKIIKESTKDDDYADELQRAVEKVLQGKAIKGWKLYVDSRSGTFEFEKKGIDMIVYATPMWDGNTNIPFNAMNKDGDEIEMIDKLIGKINWKPKYDIKTDISSYIFTMTKVLVQVEQAYGKLKQKKTSNESINEDRSISQIAGEIARDWKSVNYAAKPYLQAMYSLDKITDKYGMDSGKGIVAYFLSNAGAWKGDTAKKIKAELKSLLK